MKKFLVVGFACLMVACSNNHSNYIVETIDINKCFENNQLDLVRKNYAYDGFVVKLETNDDCLLRMGGDFYFSNERIFIKQNTIYIFDFNGKYINKLKIGNGYGEIAQVRAVDFDAEINELVVFQKPYVKYYSPDGVFLREKEVQYSFSDIKAIEGGYILQSDAGYMQCKEKPNATLLYVDKEFNLISAHFEKIEKAICYDMQRVYYDQSAKKAIIPNRNDTIYCLDNKQLTPKYLLDYSTCRFDYSINNIETWFAEEAKRYEWWYYFETSTHQFFGLTKGGLGCNIFRDKFNGKLLSGVYYDINALFNVTPLATYGDYFVSIKSQTEIDGELEKLDLFAAEDLAKIHNQAPEDNPLLIFFKLKPFDNEE